LKIRVDDIKEKPLVLAEEADADTFPPLGALVESGEAVILEPVSVHVRAQREYDHIRVNAEASTRMKVTCSRCLTDFDTAVKTSFTIFYRKGDPGTPSEDEVELAEVDLIAASYQGDEIDLDPEIGDQVVMEIPIKPLCSDACRGLCTVCGADLNKGECGCSRESGDLRFTALKNLKLDK